MGLQEWEGPVRITQLAPGVTLVSRVYDAETSQNVAAGADAESRCAKCARRFDPEDTSFDGEAQYRGTPFCRRCVDACHDTEIADHWCMVDQWQTDNRGARDAD